MKVSAVIVALNEEDRIEACLESVSFCNEIVVVDAGSADGTVEKAKRYTDKVVYHEWESFRSQRAYAISLATQPWILLIDADERVTGELKSEILALPNDPPEEGFYLRRDFYFMGRLMRHGGAWPDWVLRLFRADRFSLGGTETHDKVEVPGAAGKLAGPLKHYSYRNLSDYFQRFNKYTTLGAEERHKRGVKPGFIQNFRVPYEFLMRYVIRGGFLDGYPGFVYALISSFYAWTKYAKLKEMMDHGREKLPEP